uniref:Uncharacterized protein n=1 Tax=Oryza punctata TaxID=4537 RepID=A0A0E0KU10_ORYPU
MSDAYKKAKPGRLVFKGGEAASLHKPPKKHKKNKKPAADGPADDEDKSEAAKPTKDDDLFPVETKKFGYDPANAAKASRSRTVEEALDDRVRKKADRYCK